MAQTRIPGTVTESLQQAVDISPDSQYVEQVSGLTHVPQNEAGGGNPSYYDVNNAGDQLDIDISAVIEPVPNPVVQFQQLWGEGAVEIIDIDTNTTIVDEYDGFGWGSFTVRASDLSGRFRLTGFDDPNVNGTDAAWRDVVTVTGAKS